MNMEGMGHPPAAPASTLHAYFYPGEGVGAVAQRASAAAVFAGAAGGSPGGGGAPGEGGSPCGGVEGEGGGGGEATGTDQRPCRAETSLITENLLGVGRGFGQGEG